MTRESSGQNIVTKEEIQWTEPQIISLLLQKYFFSGIQKSALVEML